MSTYSDPVQLVVGGVVQGPASGQQWEGGTGVLMVSGVGAGPVNFEATIDQGVTWIGVQNMASGLIMKATAGTAITVDGAYPFSLGSCRIRISGTTGTANIQAARY